LANLTDNEFSRLRVLITGANGQIGKEVAALLAAKGCEVIGFSKPQLDVTDEQAVRKAIYERQPDIVLHAGAYTKVDQAEADADRAYAINGYGTRNVAVAAEAVGAKMIYISTDYVFDGSSDMPYDEFSPVNPINVYGRSKWIGEYFTERLCSRFFIVRTSWVFGTQGTNFIKTIMKQASATDSVNVTDDQIGCPTYTKDLAESIAGMMGTSRYGIYHISNTGSCSRYELAKTVFSLAGLNVNVQPVASDRFVRLAKRPAYTVLDHMALRLNGFPLLRPWQEAVMEMMSDFEGACKR
jgi:dTDP-4-dehydrorhamnose reductase